MNYNEVVQYIGEIPKFTKKHTLEHTREFLRRLGNPCHDKKIIHVAGTNGKGSACAFMQAILLSEEKEVGFFTSPHLVKMNERIRINGVDITDEDFVEAFVFVKNVVDQMAKEEIEHPSYFEFLYGMGMVAFANAGVEYVILETGLGGRLDATNSFEHPVMSVITSIGLDHTAILGNTIAEIASEKAGIIKTGVPVVFDASQSESANVIRQKANEMDSPCKEIGKDAFEIREISDKNIAFSILSEYDNDNVWRVKGTGVYQAMNATLAIEAMKYLFADTTDYSKWKSAIASVNWSGRMEEILPGVILDGAHNLPAIEKFVESMQFQKEVPYIILFSAVADKDYEGMIELLCKKTRAQGYVITRLQDERGVQLEVLADQFRQYADCPVYAEDNLEKAFAYAMDQKGAEGRLYCLGSLYLVGELKQLIGGGAYA